ncbi:hypothetical protein VCE7224_02459 [Vibrio celticus]|uniref:Uncharacterized protein n=1 Tax=Vibrio celticus TaxID=446372 RepID=A0A1C3JEZ1_9VIBR|nr:hypothetical protein VCE7224_02459 [Vibrio celticus]
MAVLLFSLDGMKYQSHKQKNADLKSAFLFVFYLEKHHPFN